MSNRAAGSAPVVSPERRVSPALTEPSARGFTDFLGGPTGRFGLVGRARHITPLRVLIAVALTFLALGYLQKAACLGGAVGADGTIGLNWAGDRQYAAACYNDILPLYAGRGLDEPGFVYAYSWQEGDLTRYMEYPVLAGLFQGAVGWLTRTTYPVFELVGAPVPEASWYFTLTALLFSVCWVLSVRMLAELAGNRIWDIVLVAASPLLIVHAFTNWDIPSITFVVAALYAVTKNRPLAAGVFIGLGTAFKLWPLFLLGAFLVLAVRSRVYRPFVEMVAGAVVSWLIVNLPVMVAYPQAWAEFSRLNSERGWEWTTIYAVISRATGWSGFDSGGGEPVILNTVTFVLFAGSCLAIAVFGWRVARRPRVAELITLIVIAFLLFNKVWSPQYSLWLLVPAVLAVPRWRLIFTWGVADMLVWPILMWHMMGEENVGAPGWLLNVAVLSRDALIIAIAVTVVRQMLGKAPDKVRDAHQGLDPLAGPFGETDRCVLGRDTGRGAENVDKRRLPEEGEVNA